MSLKSKFVLILFFIFALFSVVDFISNRFVIFPSFLELEREEALKNLKRSIHAIEREIHHLDALCHDWSAWDETYTFVENSSQDYIDANLTLTSFIDNKLNLIYICNTSGKVVWGEIRDLENTEKIQLPEFQDNFLSSKHPLRLNAAFIKDPLSEFHKSGMFMTQKGLMMISSRPILNSDNQGPIRGTFLMGKFLTRQMIKMLVDQTQVNFQIFPIQSDSIPEYLKEILHILEKENPYWTHKGTTHSQIFTTFPDIEGYPVFLIQAKISKRICEVGDNALEYAFILAMISGFIVVIFVLVLIQRSILGPVEQLTQQALAVRESGDLSARLSMQRHDEIGTLAKEFDRMLATLEKKTIELAVLNETLEKDIIERQKTEKALRESEERYRSFVYNFQGIAFRADREFIPEFLHGAVEEISGYSEAEFLSNEARWDQIVHPEDRFEMIEMTEKLFSIPGFSNRREYRIIRKNGEIRWLHQFVSNICDDERTPIYVQGAIYDITDRIQAEEALRKSEHYYRSLLYSMHDDIIVVDRNHRITDVNKRFLLFANCSRDEAIGQYCFDVFEGFFEIFERRGDNRKLRDVFYTGKPHKCRYEYINKEGINIWTDFLMSPLINEDQMVTHVIVAMRDVTKESQLEHQVRQTQKMEAIGTLAGGIAHDFNNILMSVMINIEFALKKLQKDTSICETLELSLQACHRAKDLVEQILTFSRKSENEAIPLKIVPVIKESLKMLRSSLPSTIEIHQHIEAEYDSVLAAPSQIHQILFNLCTNAAYSMRHQGGILFVSLVEDCVDHTEISRTQPDATEDYLRLTVKDTGEGIAPEILDRIFEPFFTLKKPGEGTGMGLAVVHGILSEMGGMIKVRSTLKKGTVVDVFLPQIENEAAFTIDSTIKLPLNGEGRVLLIDDEKFLVQSLERALKDLGYYVQGETNSIQALKLFKQRPELFDLIITDQTMPRMTGVELSKEFLSIRPDIPIILYTGSNEAINETHAASLGIRKFLIKPIITSELAEIISSILNKEFPQK